MPFCKNCGRELPDGAKFCLNCGVPQDREESTLVSKSETADNETNNKLDSVNSAHINDGENKSDDYGHNLTYSRDETLNGDSKKSSHPRKTVAIVFLVIIILLVAFVFPLCMAKNKSNSNSRSRYTFSSQNANHELTSREAYSAFVDYLSSYSGSNAVESALLSHAPSGTNSIRNMYVETIEEANGTHDYNFSIYGTFTAYDRYGEIVDFCTFEMKGWVDSDGRTGMYTGATVRR